jgi:hypothetical protein
MASGGQTAGGKSPSGGHSSAGAAPQNITINNPNGGQPSQTPPQPAPQSSQQDYVNTSLTGGSYSTNIRPIA